MSKRKPKAKPCWDVDVYELLQRNATVRVSAWTRDEAMQMALKGDHATVEWDEGDWSPRAIVNDPHTGHDGGSVRIVVCDG